MEEKRYILLSKLFFWLFFLAFVFITPIVVFQSLGYKFNFREKKIQRTGIISVKTFPEDAKVFLSDRQINKHSPCVIRELLPGDYTLSIEKEGFFEYKVSVIVRPFCVSDIDVTLVPQIKSMEKLKLGLSIYKFFIVEHLLEKEIIAFTDEGIYLISADFKNIKRLISLGMDKTVVETIEGLKSGKNKFVFWNQHNIWLLKISHSLEEEDSLALIYSAKDVIRDVFFGIKENYLIIHDGIMVNAFDIKNYSFPVTIFELKSIVAKIFYDLNANILYVRDRIAGEDDFSLLKINVMEFIHEKKPD